MFRSRCATSVALTAIATLMFATTAHAIPALQLYSPDAVYDNASQSWLVTSNSFELWVVGDVGSKGPIYDVDLAASYYGSSGSIVLTPNLAIDPTPEDAGGYNNIVNHAEYADADGHMFWHVGDLTSTADVIQDYTGLNGGTSTGTIFKLMVNVSGYEAVHFDAFDHYYTGGGQGAGANYQTHYVFAPFSHDLTGGGGSSGGGGVDVAEPGSLWMFGVGLAGMFAAKRRKRKA